MNNCDEVIVVDDDPEPMEVTDTPGPSRKRKPSKYTEIIEILDSDDEIPEKQTSIAQTKKFDRKKRDIQAVVNEIKSTFGRSSLIVKSSIGPALWQSLCQILETSYRNSPDFSFVRGEIVESGVIRVLFDCLGSYSHQSDTIHTSKPGTSRKLIQNMSKTGNKMRTGNLNDKGIGFGHGTFSSVFKPEDLLKKKLEEEKHVTAILQILASFMNPQDDIPSDTASLPGTFVNSVENSCLVPVLRSYLRNDSVLDMSQHITLYRAILLLVRAISTCSQLVHLLMVKKDINDEPIAELLGKIKTCTETYKARMTGIADDDMEINIFVEDILTTSFLVESATVLFIENKSKVARPKTMSIEEKYLEVMKDLRFDSFEIINDEQRFVVSYHFAPTALKNGTQGSASRIKRLAQEQATLPNSLPLSFSSSVFVRSDNSRMDVLKFLVTGPTNTPYENGCFIFDVYFPPEYPNSPPLVNLETTGRHQVRFNPNLYNCGKVCLSLLNTWNGRPEERWNAKTSSFLQVLVSIQSLILVDDPYFNEPGCQAMRSMPGSIFESKNYNNNLYPNTILWAMIDNINNPVPCFKDVIQKHFYLKRNEIMAQVDKWTKDSPQVAALKSQLAQAFLKLPVPAGLENFSIDTPEMNRKILEKIAKEKVEVASTSDRFVAALNQNNNYNFGGFSSILPNIPPLPAPLMPSFPLNSFPQTNPLMQSQWIPQSLPMSVPVPTSSQFIPPYAGGSFYSNFNLTPGTSGTSTAVLDFGEPSTSGIFHWEP